MVGTAQGRVSTSLAPWQEQILRQVRDLHVSGEALVTRSKGKLATTITKYLKDEKTGQRVPRVFKSEYEFSINQKTDVAKVVLTMAVPAPSELVQGVADKYTFELSDANNSKAYSIAEYKPTASAEKVRPLADRLWDQDKISGGYAALFAFENIDGTKLCDLIDDTDTELIRIDRGQGEDSEIYSLAFSRKFKNGTSEPLTVQVDSRLGGSVVYYKQNYVWGFK